MPGRRDHDQLVAEKRHDRELRVLERGTNHRQVELVAQDLFLDAGARADLERDDQPWMQLLESAQRRRQEVDADGRACPNPQRAALDATHLFDCHGGLVQHAEHPPRVAVKKSARLGELDALSKPVKQRQAKGFLELLDLVGD